ncbi:hypothetical protein XW60_14750 [Mycobacteroides abscessus subsp. bolletii]|nr:hypothetical protein XW60_14750 [Mycobacteroides abscessus subsp. bolletii]
MDEYSLSSDGYAVRVADLSYRESLGALYPFNSSLGSQGALKTGAAVIAHRQRSGVCRLARLVGGGPKYMIENCGAYASVHMASRPLVGRAKDKLRPC